MLKPSRGDVRSDGFICYGPKSKRGGELSYSSPYVWHKDHVSRAHYNARIRSQKKNIPFTTDLVYLLSIFPEDSICPIFHTKMEWGGDLMTSPSLDRIQPELGYVPGNVMWISNRANTLKGANSLDTLKRLVSFYEDRLRTH